MNVSVITTINHNVGDDFVREGILYLLEQQLGNFNCQLIHKHIPLTARPEWEWFYASGLSSLLDRLPRGRGLFWSKLIDHLPLRLATDKVLACDLLIQSGAPVYWEKAYCNEWFQPLIQKRLLSMHPRPLFINIGAGTCQPYDSDGTEIVTNLKTAKYIRNLYSLCDLTTLRDKLSQRILCHLGLDAPVITCPSIFARDRLQIAARQGEYVALNFMPLGGHYDYSGDSPTSWEKTFVDFYTLLAKRTKTLIVCHTENELKAVRRILPESNTYLGATASDYLNIYSGAKYFVGCRVHAAFATASFAKPAFVVGNDTRARMTEELGLTSVSIKDVTVDLLMRETSKLESEYEDYAVRFAAIKEEAFKQYSNLLKPVCERLIKHAK